MFFFIPKVCTSLSDLIIKLNTQFAVIRYSYSLIKENQISDETNTSYFYLCKQWLKQKWQQCNQNQQLNHCVWVVSFEYSVFFSKNRMATKFVCVCVSLFVSVPLSLFFSLSSLLLLQMENAEYTLLLLTLFCYYFHYVSQST